MRTSRTSCSSTPSGPALPRCATTGSGPRRDGKSAKARTASRSSASPRPRLAAHSTPAKTTTSPDRPGETPTGSPTSGTCPTAGPPVSDAGSGPPRDPPARVWDALCWLARRQGYAVEVEHGPPPDGTVFWAVRRIRIPPQITDEQAVWALAHQLGHVLLHHGPGYPPGTTTTGCTGLRKAEANSVAWITCARHGIPPPGGCPTRPAGPAPTRAPSPPPPSWPPASTSPQQPPASPATPSASCTATTTPPPASPPAPPPKPGTPAQANSTTPPRPRQALRSPSQQPASHPGQTTTRRVLADAQAFYTGQLAGSWAPGYLHARGITAAAIQDWHIGYAPAGWTTLTGHLRRLGHHDDAIQAAGLATRSSRGTLIDRFRDRIMLPVHDAAGMLAGFTGRARPGAGPDVPKYLNSPETAAYKKSHLLFGLHQARPALARGAVPVIAEGPFDAIAITIADPGRHAGLAPCGTALTSQQAALLSQAADLSRTGIIVAFDSDAAGAKPPSAPTASSAPSPATSSQPFSTARTRLRSCNGTARMPSAASCAISGSRCPPCSSMPASSNGDGAWTTPTDPSWPCAAPPA